MDWEKIDQIEGLSTKTGLSFVSGDKDSYKKSLKITIKVIEKSQEKLANFLTSGDSGLHDFSVEVHGLKTSLANIGADELSAKAKDLEKAANAADKDFCNKNFPSFLEGITKLKDNLSAAFATESAGQGSTETPPEFPLILKKLTTALNETDFMAIDQEIKNLTALELSGALSEEVEKIKDAVLVMDYDKALEVIGLLGLTL